jgi:hypothetical protein
MRSGPLVTVTHAESLLTVNSTTASSFLSLLADLSSFPTDQLPGWQPFHSILLVFSSQADFQLTTELDHPIVFLITTLHRPSRKRRFKL